MLAAAVLVAGLSGWWWWRPFRVEIEGASMAPTLEPGDWALAVRVHQARAGDVVVIEHPERAGFELVKRIVAGPRAPAPDGRVLGSREVWVEGDAAGSSSDSRSFGPVSIDAVRARVVLVWWPPENVGPVRLRA